MNPARKLGLWLFACLLILVGGITAAYNPVVGIVVTCGSIAIFVHLLLDMFTPPSEVETA